MLGRRYTALLIAVLLVLVTASCRHEASPGDGDSTPASPVSFAELNALLTTAPRLGSVSIQTTIAGGDADAFSGSNSDLVYVGSGLPYRLKLNLAAEPDVLAWAVYAFQSTDSFGRFDALQLWAVEPVAGTGSDFVGIADYTSNSWRWIPVDLQVQPDVAGVTPVYVPLPSDINPVSPQGYTKVVLVSLGQQVLIDKVSLIADEAAPPPMNFGVTQGREVGVGIGWTDPALTYDPDGSGPDEFIYDSVRIERQNNDAPFNWQVVAEIHDYHDSVLVYGGQFYYVDGYAYSPPWSEIDYNYRLSTVVNGVAGRPTEVLTGIAGVPPVAIAGEITGTAPNIVLDSTGSYDPDLTDHLYGKIWTVTYPTDDNDFSANIGAPSDGTTDYTISDLTKLNRFVLTVYDNEGLDSYPKPDASSYVLWSPDNACVTDDATKPDPKDTIEGQGPGSYTVKLAFVNTCNDPSYKYELDSNFTGIFNLTDGVQIVLLKDFATAPNGEGPIEFTVNIPADQPDGKYYFALRVTDGSGNEWIYMWPERVTLEPQP